MPPFSARPAVVFSLLALLLSACGPNTPTDTASSAPASAPAKETKEAAAPSESASDPLAALSEFAGNPSVATVASEAPTNIEKDFKNWTLPTDKYFVFDYVGRDKAERKKAISCLEEAGFKPDFPEIDESPEAIADLRRSIQTLLVLSDAHVAAVGYAKESVQGTNKGFKQAFFKLANEADPSQLDKVKHCTKAFYLEENVAYPFPPSDYEELGVENNRHVPSPLLVYAKQALEPEAQTPEMIAIFDKWRTCMAPTGADLTSETPMSMPPASKSQEWDQAMRDSGKPFFIPEDHLTFAKQDASCRESSGFNEAVYNLQWNFYEQHVKDNPAYYEKALIWHQAKNKDLEEFFKK